MGAAARRHLGLVRYGLGNHDIEAAGAIGMAARKSLKRARLFELVTTADAGSSV